MCAAKKASKSPVGPVGDLVVWAFGPGRAVAASLLVLGAFLFAWWAVWRHVGPEVVQSERYLLKPDALQIPTQPDWIPGDLRAEVYQSIKLGGPINLLDDELGPRVAEAFARNPWIEQVVEVRKLPSAAVQVDLKYRRPVCVVKAGERLLAVDHRSILLPVDGMTPSELERYPQLVGIDRPPVAIPGEPWGSARVAGGAAIANVLAKVWDAWHLTRIVPFPVITQDGREQTHYSLFTIGGTRITWGLPPGLETPGEISTQEKLARLTVYFSRHGTFDGPAGPLDLDVRSLPGL